MQRFPHYIMTLRILLLALKTANSLCNLLYALGYLPLSG
jgi:hypothetical protein